MAGTSFSSGADVRRQVDVIRVDPQAWPHGTPAEKAEDPISAMISSPPSATPALIS